MRHGIRDASPTPTRRHPHKRVTGLWWCILLLGCTPGWAHELRPAVLDLVLAERPITATLRINAEALLAGIGPEHDSTDRSPASARYEALRALSAEELAQRFVAEQSRFLASVDARDDRQFRLDWRLADVTVLPAQHETLPRDTLVRLTAPLPDHSRAVSWQWATANGSLILRAGAAEAEDSFSALLAPGERSPPLAISGEAAESLGAIIKRYLWSGVIHIVPRGLDHILFVVGLFLLAPWWRPIFWQISSFTAAHTLTLALATLGYLSVPAAIVEPLIALSIAIVALENLLTSRLHRWRPALVFAFGLLHGLGFASVLSDVGLTPTAFIPALVSFNIGVELAQLGIVLLCFTVLGWPFRQRHWYRQRITVPGSLLIAGTGLFWFVQRVSA